MDRSLALLFASAVVNAVVVVRAPVSRGEKLALGLLQVIVACIAVAAALALAMLGAASAGGRSLVVCGAGALLVVIAGGPPSTHRLERWSTAVFAGLLLCGLLSEVIVATGVAHGGGRLVVIVPALAALAGAAALVQLCGVRLRAATSVLARTRVFDDATAAALVAVAGVCAVVVDNSLWAGLVAVAASLATAARAAQSPPDRRDAAVIVVGVIVGALVVDVGQLPLLLCALGVALVAGRSLLIPPRTAIARPVTLAGGAAPDGLSGIVPLLDDALLRRPGRPRVLARTPARRLLDAALDRAQRAQPQHRGRPPIDVTVGEGEADVDGDPSELAEALCTVLDNALRQQARHPWARVSVVVRAAAQTVSFEVNDTAPDVSHEDVPFMGGRVDDVDRPGLGVSLARARLLVEKHGGQLHARHGPEGSAVQVTLPRRLGRSSLSVV